MSDARNRLVRNVLFSAVSWFSSLVFLLILVLAARYLGDVVYGRFTFAFAFVALFEVATDVGLRDYLVREVARARDETGRFLGTALFVKAALSAATLLVLVLGAGLVTPRDDVRLTIQLLALAMVCKSFKLVFRSILVAHERFRREALVVNLERAVLLVACATALVLGADLVEFTAVFLAGSAFGLVLTVLLTGRELRRPSRPERWGKSWAILRHSLPFGLSVAAFAIYFRLDSVMLSLMRGDAEVGWYNAAYRLTEGLIVVPMVLQNALMPRMSVLHVEESGAVPQLVRRTSKYLIAIALPVAVFGILGADWVIQVIYGEEFAPAADALAILLGGLGFMFLWSLFTSVLNATNRPHVPLLGVTLGSALNVGLNFLLIPLWGHIGASLSTLVAEIFLFTFLLRALAQGDFTLELMRSLLRPVIALVPSAGAMALLGQWSMLPALVVATASYMGILLLVGFLDPSEREALAHLGKRLLLRLPGRGASESSS